MKQTMVIIISMYCCTLFSLYIHIKLGLDCISKPEVTIQFITVYHELATNLNVARIVSSRRDGNYLLRIKKSYVCESELL